MFVESGSSLQDYDRNGRADGTSAAHDTKPIETVRSHHALRMTGPDGTGKRKMSGFLAPSAPAERRPTRKHKNEETKPI